MVAYPKLVKPWRGYPSSNTLMAIRLRVDQNPPANTDPLQANLGTAALTVGKPYHIGTIPKGSFILPSIGQVRTAFTGTTPTIKIGNEADDDGLVLTTDWPLATPAVKEGISNALTGVALTDIVVWAILAGTGITAGAFDWVCPFYIQKD